MSERIGELAVTRSPELVAEVASSSVSYDLHAKLHVYRRNGVREYLVWRVLEQAIDWFVLRAGQYERLPVEANGWLRSTVFPGLWLDPAALVRSELATVLAIVQQGLGSPEHTRLSLVCTRRRQRRRMTGTLTPGDRSADVV